MRRRTALFLGTIPFLLVLGWAAGPVLAGDPCYHSTDRPATSSGATVAITVQDCVFSPTVTTVPVGSNLTWGAHEKLVPANGGSIGWKFDKPGVYAYTCMLHPGMSGAIVVGGPTTAAADAQLASDVQAPTSDAAATDGGSMVPILAVGGIGLLAGILIGGLGARAMTRRDRAI